MGAPPGHRGREGFGGRVHPSSISPDGSTLLFEANDVRATALGDRVSRLFLLPLNDASHSHARMLLSTGFEERDGMFSPDGKWVAYVSNESGSNQVYVVPYPRKGSKVRISAGASGSRPRWRSDGREIFYLTGDGQLMATEVSIRNGALEPGKTQQIAKNLLNAAYLYDVTTDGQKFLVARPTVAADANMPPLTLIQNWPALLRK